MNYCLVILEGFKITPIQGYSKIPGFEHLNEKKLLDITTFTNSFADEFALKDFLKDTRIVDRKALNGTIRISKMRGKEITGELVDNGVSYEPDKYLFSFDNITTYFFEHLSDKEFMGKFLYTFCNSKKNVPLYENDIENLKTLLSKYEKNGYYELGAKDSIYNLLRLLSYKKKDYGYELDFTQFRKLVMFVIDHERKKLNVNKDYTYSDHLKIDDVRTMIEHYESVLNDGNITDEQRAEYEYLLNKLLDDLEYLETNNPNGRR